jgi:dihydrofolate synthase/folylpolyglutamate synthase
VPALNVPTAAYEAGVVKADWPARMQRLTQGSLLDLAPVGSELWLDGGHNPAAARAIADFFRARLAPGRPFNLILGMLANKDLRGFLEPFAGSGAQITAVPVPGHEHHDAHAIGIAAENLGLTVSSAPDVPAAIEAVAAREGAAPVVLIGGSLYLAGTVLAENGTPPS